MKNLLWLFISDVNRDDVQLPGSQRKQEQSLNAI